MQYTSHLDCAGFSMADAVVPVHAPVDAVKVPHAHAANDAMPLPADAIRMRDAYFDYELI
jgi:hypothetical protein